MEMQKELIRELGQRGGKEFDYLFILKSLNEIKFPVGKTLLVDFLIGNLKNPSIKKNDLFEKYNFGKLRYYTESEIRSMIDNLIANAMIELTNYSQNKFAQVLELNSKGSEELMNPKLYKKKITLENKKTNISEEEKLLFSELDYLLRGYNDEQKKAIISNKKNILCIAGAGSGKTSVLTKRIDFLVRYRSVNPSKILAITFTRKARSEMQHKLEKHGIIGVNIETFNSFSEKILKKYSPLIYSRPTRVMSYQDKIFLISFALNELNLSMQEAAGKYFSESQKKNKEEQRLINIFINDCFSVIEYFKSKNQKLYDFSKDASKEEYESAKMISKICMSIEKQMKILGLRDYIDQI
ncbi:MAG: UvrD-helicase domain-containing protein, partial [Candidatus Nanoarchaeia archaeon]